MELTGLADSYIETSDNILRRIEELKTQLKKDESLTNSEQRKLRRRIRSLESMYYDTRGIGRKLKREYGGVNNA